MRMDKVLYNSADIAEDLSISTEEAVKLMKELCSRLEHSGNPVINGYVPKAYYEKQKEGGFLRDAGDSVSSRISLKEKRLLSLEEFCEYAGGIGICTARKYAKRLGIEVKIGGRCLVDREKFDRWCDNGNNTE